MPANLDQIDRQLIAYLQPDARLSLTELGRRVGLAVSSVNERLKKLESRGVIRDYVVRLYPRSVGLDICAFVQVLVTGPDEEVSFADRVSKLAEVQECHCVTGDFSYLLKVRVRDTEQLEDLLRKKVKSMPGVIRTDTMIVLSTRKESTAVELPVADLE